MAKHAAIALCFGLVASACDTTAPVVREEVPFRVLLQSSGFFEDYALNPEGDQESVPPVSAFLTSDEAEAEFLNDYPRKPHWTDDGGPFYESFPNVNYTTETAVVVALGTTGSGSVLVRVDSVVSGGRTATVYTTTVLPCFGTRDFANPSIVVALERKSRSVDFAEPALEREECL